jgi:hypothetical protein
MADDNSNNSSSSNSSNESREVSYVRKKNIIPGIDNDHLIIGGLVTLTGIVLAPHIKQILDNFMRGMPQNQNQANQSRPQPGNGSAIPNPPAVTHHAVQVPAVPPTPQEQELMQKYPEHDLLRQHEQRLKEQEAYKAALEQETYGGSQSISMVPDRSRPADKSGRSHEYEAGSNVSAGF